jgi:hypothetical protein
MEKMLHDIGVCYFWQIAEWTPVDVVHADAQLKAFHGRIARDGWVAQAKDFTGRAESVRRPANLSGQWRTRTYFGRPRSLAWSETLESGTNKIPE